jgi:alpha-tubulin suppressor-like RCC1 family protein
MQVAGRLHALLVGLTLCGCSGGPTRGAADVSAMPNGRGDIGANNTVTADTRDAGQAHAAGHEPNEFPTGPVVAGGRVTTGQPHLRDAGADAASDAARSDRDQSRGPWQAIATGNRRSCAIRDGQLWCWGQNGDGALGPTGADLFERPAQVGSDADWQVIALRDRHACGIRAGRLLCWGDNELGKLGVGDENARLQPTFVGSAQDWTAVSVGNDHSCAVRGGEMYCFGSNESGQLGDGTMQARSSPVRAGADSDFTQVSVGRQSSCGLRGDALSCWGRNNGNQLGFMSGYPDNELVPHSVSAGWSALSFGGQACGINQGALICWGWDWNTSNESLTSRQIGPDTTWTAIAVSSDYACGIDAGFLNCWGGTYWVGSALGQGQTGAQQQPGRVGAASDWDAVATGLTHACALRHGHAYCWGANDFGQLGTGDLTERTTPVAVVDE